MKGRRLGRSLRDDSDSIFGGLREAAGEAVEAISEGATTFGEGFVSGASLRYLQPEWGGLEEDTTAETITKTAGDIAGTLATIQVGTAAIGAAAAGLGVSGPLVPVAAATIASLTYSALENTDISSKGLNAVIDIAAGSIAGGLAVRKGIKGAQKVVMSEVGQKFIKAVKEGTDEFLEPAIVGELKMFQKENRLIDQPIEDVVTKAITGMMNDPSKYTQKMPSLSKKLASVIFDANGIVKTDVTNMQAEIGTAIKETTDRVLKQAAFERGLELTEESAETILGRPAAAIRKTWFGLKKSLADPANLLVEQAGPDGAKAYQMADDAHTIITNVQEFSARNMEPILKPLAILKRQNKTKYKALSQRINAALDNRAHAGKYLKDKFDADVYEAFKADYDFWKEELKIRGVGVLEDYSPHMREVLKGAKGTIGTSIPNEFHSSFFMKREGMLDAWVDDDLLGVHGSYVNSVSRKLGFDNLVKWYDTTERNPFVAEFINGVVNNPRTPGGLIDWALGQRYNNLVAFNPFSAVSNMSQQEVAKALVSEDAIKMSRKLMKLKDPEVVNFLNRSFARAYMDVLPEQWRKGKWFDPLRFFEQSENFNWKVSRSLGVAEELVRDGRVGQFVKEGMKFEDAVMKVVGDKKVWDRAMIRGKVLASRTQFTMAKGMKPSLFGELIEKHPILRLPLQFRRFQFSQAESVFNLLRGMKGQELDIMRRNFKDEVNVVQRLKAMRTMKDGAKRMMKEVTDPKEKEFYKGLHQELSEDIPMLVDEVKRIEPRDLVRSSYHIGKMIAKGTMPKFARSWLKWGVIGWMFDKTFTIDEKTRDLKWQAAGQIPGVEGIRGFDLSPRYFDPKYGIVSYAMGITPGLGLIDASIPGRPLTRLVHKELFGKPEKKKRRGHKMGERR